MRAVDDTEAMTVSLRMKPGESTADFAARVARAHGPLTQAEIAKLRKIFAPRTTTAAPVGTSTAA